MTEKEYLQMLEGAVADKNPFVPLENGKPVIGKWTRIEMPGFSCANGEPYCCYLKKGTSNNLIIFMIGGGLFWDEKSATYPATPRTIAEELPGLYTSTVTPANEYWFFASKLNNGILSNDEGNPFRDWNIGMVNYGTGDFHLGCNEVHTKDLAGKDITVHCQGFQNLHGCMEVFQSFLTNRPEKLLICGESAGGFAVPGVAEEILGCYEECMDVTLLTDSSLLLRRDWKKVASEIWNVPDYLMRALYSEDILSDWYGRLAQKYKDKLTYLYICGRHDVALAQYQNYMDGGAFEINRKYLDALPGKLEEQKERLAGLSGRFGFYYHDFPDETGMGSQHMTLTFPSFLEGNVDGVTPAEWLWDALQGDIKDIGRL